MSTRIGTMQAPRDGRAIWLAAAVTVFVVMTVATIATSITPGERTDTPASGRIVAGLAGGVAADTPSELSGGIVQGNVGGTAANTPSELSGGVRHEFVSGTAGNTPSELSGGLTQIGEARAQHQRI